MGTNAQEYDEKYTKDELYEKLKALGVKGISKDDKSELIRKLLVAEGKAVNITRPSKFSDQSDEDVPTTVTPSGKVGGPCRECPKYNLPPDKECQQCWANKHKSQAG